MNIITICIIISIIVIIIIIIINIVCFIISFGFVAAGGKKQTPVSLRDGDQDLSIFGQ